MSTDRIVLAHSGGLGTSVAIGWTAAELDQSLATGFVEPRGLPSEIAAERDGAAQ